MADDLDRLLSGGAKSAFNKDSKPGDTITGIITDIAVRQATEYGTGTPLLFPSGDPKEQIIVTIKAEGIIPDDEDDDMHRSIYIKGWGPQKRAFIEEARKSGKPAAGDRFTATYVRDEPSKQGGFASKVYEYRIQALDYAAPVHAEDGYAEARRQAEKPLNLGGFTNAEDGYAEARRQAEKLLNLGGFTKAQIAATTGLPEDEIEAMTNVPF